MLPGLIKGLFAPAPVTERFAREFPTAMMLRPLQLRASAEDAALMTPVTMALPAHYADLTLPVVIVAGADDQVADVGRQSQRLHHALPGSELVVIPGMGHMIHHLAPADIVAAIERASALAETRGAEGSS